MTRFHWAYTMTTLEMLNRYLSLSKKVTGKMLTPSVIRKLRLFVSACCYATWGSLSNEARKTIGVIEQAADEPSIFVANVNLMLEESRLEEIDQKTPLPRPDYLVYQSTTQDVVTAARLVANNETPEASERLRAHVLREVLGNPFESPRWDVAWATKDVTHLARLAYDERAKNGAIDRTTLLLLADAIEDAGGHHRNCDYCKNGVYEIREDGQAVACDLCMTSDLLTHLRAPGPHYRGCWAVDFVRGLK